MNPHRPSRLQRLSGALGIAMIKLYLRLFGRKVRKTQVPWLLGPIGPTGEIGDRPYQLVADQEGLVIDHAAADAGLVPDFNALAGPDFDITRVDPAVRRSYENTAQFELDVWSRRRARPSPRLTRVCRGKDTSLETAHGRRSP